MKIEKEKHSEEDYWSIKLDSEECDYIDVLEVKKVILNWFIENSIYRNESILKFHISLANRNMGDGICTVINTLRYIGDAVFFNKANIEFKDISNRFIPEIEATVLSKPTLALNYIDRAYMNSVDDTVNYDCRYVQDMIFKNLKKEEREMTYSFIQFIKNMNGTGKVGVGYDMTDVSGLYIHFITKENYEKYKDKYPFIFDIKFTGYILMLNNDVVLCNIKNIYSELVKSIDLMHREDCVKNADTIRALLKTLNLKEIIGDGDKEEE